MAEIPDLHVKDYSQQITLRVRGLRGVGMRLWIARQLFLLGCKVARVGLIIEQHDSPDSL